MIKEDDHILQRERKKRIKIFGYLTIGKRRKEKKNAKENKANRKKEGSIKHIILLGKETKMKKKKVNKNKKKKETNKNFEKKEK